MRTSVRAGLSQDPNTTQKAKIKDLAGPASRRGAKAQPLCRILSARAGKCKSVVAGLHFAPSFVSFGYNGPHGFLGGQNDG
jgi:hypothetical protein